MRLNCLAADSQQIRDLLCILSFCDKLQYFALPKCELLQLRAGGLSGFSLCRFDIGYLNPFPSAFSHRDGELMCPRRIKNILGTAKFERKSAGRDHLLTRELAIEFLFELAKAPRAQIVSHPGRTASQPRAAKSPVRRLANLLAEPSDRFTNVYRATSQKPFGIRHDFNVPILQQPVQVRDRFV